MSRTQERQQGPQRRQRALPGALAQTVDATALEVLASPRATPLLIAHTLANGTTDEIATAPDGALALVATTGETGRVYAQGRPSRPARLPRGPARRCRTTPSGGARHLASRAPPHAASPNIRLSARPAPPSRSIRHGRPTAASSPTWRHRQRRPARTRHSRGTAPTELFLWNSRTDKTRKLENEVHSQV
jgi:hypothetical protein